MARWRGKKRMQRTMALGVFGALAFVLLAFLATKIPWDSVSFVVLVLILLGFAGYAINSLIHVVKFHIGKAEKFERAERVKSVAQMSHLTPTEFEHYVGTLYEGLGYSVTVTRQSGDQGIDLVLKDKDGATTGVQVKRYQSSRVGVPELQHLVGASRKKYDKMIFVTSSDYLHTARQYATEQGIVLVDGEALTAMAQKVFGENHDQKSLAWKIFKKWKS